jgi:uncharacterized membrane protein
MSSDAEILREVPLFQFLDDQEREALAEEMEPVRYATGETVFIVNEPGDAIYIIKSGEMEVHFKNDTGERIVLEVASRGHYFGELSLLDRGCRSASVTATQDSEVLRLSHDKLESFIRSHPQAAMDLLASMGRRLRVSAERLRHTASRNVNEQTEDLRSMVQKTVDWIAEFAGSISFLVIHVIWFGLWILVNVVKMPGIPQFDPFPFGFLTLTVSLEAIFLSVFVLLSQNRQAAKDRVRADIEYDVNLKAELEISHLHEKMDRLTADVLARLDDLRKRPVVVSHPQSGGQNPAARD